MNSLKRSLARLCYPEYVVQSTIRQVIASKVSEGSHTQVSVKRKGPVTITLPFKNQNSTNGTSSLPANAFRWPTPL